MLYDSDSSIIEVGYFGRPFGVSGWIKVNSFTDPLNKILEYSPWLININNVYNILNIDDFNKKSNYVMIKANGYSSYEKAIELTNLKISVYRNSLPKLNIDEYYWCDLMGLNVINKNNVHLGILKDLIITGANDVLVVIGKDRYLIPYISQSIIKIDLDNKIIFVDYDFF